MASKFTLGELVWKITGENTGLDKTLKKSEENVKKSSSAFKKLGAVILTAFSVTAITRFTKAVIKGTSDAIETANKFNVTFKGVGDAAAGATDELVNTYKLATQEAQAFLSQTGDLLTGLQFQDDVALQLSQTVTKLGLDLASFTNIEGGAARATQALTSLLLGEREAAKALGIAIGEADIKQLAEDRGIVGELTRQQKAVLSLELALKQSKNAIGDTLATQDQYAALTRQINSATIELRKTLGEDLLPIATLLAEKLNDLIRGFNDLDPATRKIITLAIVLGAGGGVIAQLSKQFSVLNNVLTFIPKKFAAIGLVATGALTALGFLVGEIISVSKSNKELTKELGITEAALGSLRQEINTLADADNDISSENVKELGQAYGVTAEQIVLVANGLGITSRELQKQTEAQEQNIQVTGDQVDRNKQLAGELDKINSLLNSGKVAQGEATEELTEAEQLLEMYTIKVQELIFSEDELFQLQRARAIEQAENSEGTLEQIELVSEATRVYFEELEERRAWETFKNNAVKATNAISGVFTNLFSSLSSLYAAQTDNRLASIDQELEAALTAAGIQEETEIQRLQRELDAAILAGDTELAKEKERDLQRAKLTEEFENKKKQVQYDAAVTQWNLQRSLAIADAAKALITTASATPYPFNIPLTAAQAIINGINIAAVNEAKPQKPAFKDGGVVPRVAGVPITGDNVEARLNPDEVVLNAQQQANTLFALANGGLEGLGGGERNLTVNVMLDRKVLAQSVADVMNRSEVTLDLARAGR